MAIGTPTDAPFGLRPNVAAGLAWVFGFIGGLVMLFGGGTNKFVKMAAAQSTVLWGGYFVLMLALNTIVAIAHFLAIVVVPIIMVVVLAAAILWIYTTIMGFTGKDIRLPFVAPVATQIFATQLA